MVQLNIVSLLPLQAMLQIGAIDGLCSNATDLAFECMQEAAPLVVEGRWPVIEEACPIHLATIEYSECLFEIHLALLTQEQVLSIWFALEPSYTYVSGLDRVWKAHGKPAILDWGSIPELREVAETDAILLFVNYVRLRIQEERIRILKRISHELALRFLHPTIADLAVQDATQSLEIARRDLEFRWNNGQSEWLREWLTFTRTEKVPGRSLRLPSLSRPPAVSPRTPQYPATVAPNSPESPRTPRANANREQPQIWVKNGRPLQLKFLGPPPPQVSPTQKKQDAPPPIYEVPVSVQLVLNSDAISRKAALDYSRQRRPPPSMMGDLDWAGIASDAVDRLQNKVGSSTRTKLIKGVGALLDAWDLYDAAREDDAVKGNIALLKLVGGLPAVIAMELTGFDEKLMTLENAGYSIPQVMRYSAATAQHMLSPFSLGEPGPYSQLIVGTGGWEQASDAAIEAYEERVRQAIFDARYR
ncbi:MAG: hypothetical protein ACTSX7_12755 [Alphaproteobacteria bacterium]